MIFTTKGPGRELRDAQEAALDLLESFINSEEGTLYTSSLSAVNVRIPLESEKLDLSKYFFPYASSFFVFGERVDGPQLTEDGRDIPGPWPRYKPLKTQNLVLFISMLMQIKDNVYVGPPSKKDLVAICREIVKNLRRRAKAELKKLSK